VAKYTLTIETEDSDEFVAIANRLGGAVVLTNEASVVPFAATIKQTRAAKPKAEEPVREQVGQPEPPVQPTNVDPAVLAAQNSGQGAKETAVADAAVSSDEAVTLDDLKALMTKALNANSAKTCQDAVRAAANGAPGLSAVAVEHYAAVRDALLPLAG
jgi:hypothetical protein